MRPKKQRGYICPQCGQIWTAAKFAAECCGPEIKTAPTFVCTSCTMNYETHLEASRCCKKNIGVKG